jgi:hypothetical protein
MPGADRGPNWERQADGKVLYRMSQSTPTVGLDYAQFELVRWFGAREWLVAMFTGLSFAALFVIWLYEGVSGLLVLASAIGYVVVNQVVHVHTKRRKAAFLAAAPISARNLDLSWPRRNEVFFAEYSDRALLWSLVLFSLFAGGSLLMVMHGTFGLLGFSIKPSYPLTAALCGLAIFTPLSLLFLRELRRRRRPR